MGNHTRILFQHTHCDKHNESVLKSELYCSSIIQCPLLWHKTWLICKQLVAGNMIPHTYKQSFNLFLSYLLTYLHSGPKVINVFLPVNSLTHDVCNASDNNHTIQVQKQHRWVLLHIWGWMPETVKEISIKLHTLKYTHLQSKPFKSVSIHGTVCVHYSGVHLCTLFRCSSVLNVSPSSLPHGIYCTMLLHTLPSTVIKIVINYPHLAIHCNNYPDYSIYCYQLPRPCHLLWLTTETMPYIASIEIITLTLLWSTTQIFHLLWYATSDIMIWVDHNIWSTTPDLMSYCHILLQILWSVVIYYLRSFHLLLYTIPDLSFYVIYYLKPCQLFSWLCRTKPKIVDPAWSLKLL